MLTVTLTAKSFSELQDEIELYLDQYPPAGYGTYVSSINGGGFQWEATLTRSSSCD